MRIRIGLYKNKELVSTAVHRNPNDSWEDLFSREHLPLKVYLAMRGHKAVIGDSWEIKEIF